MAIKRACGGPRKAGALHDVLPDAAALVPVLAPHGVCAPIPAVSTSALCCRGTRSTNSTALHISTNAGQRQILVKMLCICKPLVWL